jgi:DNA-binding response OmpR family regulator
MDRARLKILVADDDRDLAEMYRRYLAKLGFTDVMLASNGEEAIVKTLECRPHLVILDVMMPILNGWEVCKQIKSNPSLEGTRVIMLTGIGPSLNELTSPIYGADAHLDKPVDFSWIEKEMKRLFPDEVG